MRKPVPPAVLFDLDGTLTDPREGITRSIAFALEKMGIRSPSFEELACEIGFPLRGCFAKLMRTDDATAIEQAVCWYRERFAPVGLFENRLYDGIPETLSVLKTRGKQLILATSKPTIYATRILDHFSLSAYFTAIHGSELDGTRDVKTDLIRYILDVHCFDPSACTMVGDRGVDIAGARANRIPSLGVTWGFGSHAELTAAGAHGLCHHPAEIPSALNPYGFMDNAS